MKTPLYAALSLMVSLVFGPTALASSCKTSDHLPIPASVFASLKLPSDGKVCTPVLEVLTVPEQPNGVDVMFETAEEEEIGIRFQTTDFNGAENLRVAREALEQECNLCIELISVDPLDKDRNGSTEAWVFTKDCRSLLI